MARFVCCRTTAMLGFLLVGAILLSAGVPAVAQLPPSVTISWVTYKGSGCNFDNTNYVLSNDYKTVTFLFAGMIATTDSGLSEKRKNCIISVALNYPDGWSFTLAQVGGRGYVKLDKGVKGTFQTSYFFSGQQGTAAFKRHLEGPVDEIYEFTDDFALDIWSQCNNMPNLNINVEVRVDNPNNKNGLMTVDSVDKRVELVYSIFWKAC